MSNPEPGQVVLSMRGGSGALELGEIGDHVEIQCGPRKSQHFSRKIGVAAILEVAQQAHSAESSRHGAGR